MAASFCKHKYLDTLWISPGIRDAGAPGERTINSNCGSSSARSARIPERPDVVGSIAFLCNSFNNLQPVGSHFLLHCAWSGQLVVYFAMRLVQPSTQLGPYDWTKSIASNGFIRSG